MDRTFPIKAKIRFAYRIVIDAQSNHRWDQLVWEDTYQEYKLQQNKFNTKDNPLQTYHELLHDNPKATQLNHLISISVDHYFQQLKGKLYSITDVLGNYALPISGFKLDIINSSISDPSKHKIGITFFTPELIFLGIINECFLISENTEKTNHYETYMLSTQSRLSICYWEEI